MVFPGKSAIKCFSKIYHCRSASTTVRRHLATNRSKNIITAIMKRKVKLIGHLLQQRFYHKHLGREDYG